MATIRLTILTLEPLAAGSLLTVCCHYVARAGDKKIALRKSTVSDEIVNLFSPKKWL
jgi:hypothetical protein